MMRVRMRRLVRRLGVDIDRRQPVLPELLRLHGITVVLDVGANAGQYARRIRSWGYGGRIISFEPVDSVYRELTRYVARDERWTARQIALGDRAGKARMHVSEETVFSSLRGADERLRRQYPGAFAVREETVTVHRLDSLWPELELGGDRVFLKVDTQGYEREVLAGAGELLQSLYGIQIEASMQPLYEGEAALVEMVRLLEERDFVLAGIEPIVYERDTGVLLQADCAFLRRAFRDGNPPSTPRNA